MIDNICDEYGVSKEQADALDIENSIALKAGAGSGKTNVLTKRYLKILNDIDFIDIDNIVAITFTKKAASEMKERIRKEIAHKIVCSKNLDVKKKWVNYDILLSSANIDTIHGFCEKILRDNFESLGIDPEFTVLDDSESQISLNKLLDSIIDEFVKNPENESVIKSMISKYSTKLITDNYLKNGILNLIYELRLKGITPNDINIKETIDNKAFIDVANVSMLLVKSLYYKYKKFKLNNDFLDFDDLLLMTDELLEDDKIREKYLLKYKYILVDEFQDIDNIQKSILYKLTIKNGKIPPGKLFIVGDQKQSIYGFRGSDYWIFDEVSKKIEMDGGKIQTLSNCYRSTKNIIETINAIFSNLLTPYNDILAVKNEKTLEDVELITWDNKDFKDEKKERWDKIKKIISNDEKSNDLYRILKSKISISKSSKDYQGEIIAGRIKKLVETGNYSFKDIAILLRSRGSLKSIENVLLKRDIPYCVIGGLGFWGKSEINDIISLYNLVFNLDDTISFLTALKSPIFNFTDEDLFELMDTFNSYGSGRLIYTLEKYRDKYNNKLNIKRACDIFKKISEFNGIYSAYEILDKIIALTDYRNILMSQTNGFQRVRNLEKLQEIFKNFEKKNIYSARDLISYLNSLEETSEFDSEAFLDNEESNAVKILTIHAAKGLEFDACIIPDMEKTADKTAKINKPFILLNDDNYIVPIGINDNGILDKDINPEYKKAYDKLLNREIEESKRIFYVAATRAKKFLAFVGEKKENSKGKDNDLTGARLNSFMKQLNYALNISNKKVIKEIDGKSLIIDNKDEVIINEENKTYFTKSQTGINILSTNEEPCGNVSITTYMDFYRCPKYYYFKYIADLNDNYDKITNKFDNRITNSLFDSTERGTIVHKFLELEDISNKANIPIYIKKYIDNKDRIDINIRELQKGRLVKSLHEYPFIVPIQKEINLRGVIDRIDIYENDGRFEAYIVDYKTNLIENLQMVRVLSNYYSKQLNAYAYALKKLCNIKGFNIIYKTSYIYFLDVGEFAEIENNDETINNTIKDLLKSLPYLLGCKEFEEYKCNKNENCNFCRFYDACLKD